MGGCADGTVREQQDHVIRYCPLPVDASQLPGLNLDIQVHEPSLSRAGTPLWSGIHMRVGLDFG